jgi:HTH-type transcriptional regulator/antitoxin HigA
MPRLSAVGISVHQGGEDVNGRSNRVYEILNRKRPLTVRMIWNLHSQLGIPAESLIKQPDHLDAA